MLALKTNDLEVINAGNPKPTYPIACMGAGTGLGVCYLTWDDNAKEYNVWPSEGGHAEFAARSGVEFGLCDFIKRSERVGRVSAERVISGLGMPHIYKFLCQENKSMVLEKTQIAILNARDNTVSSIIAKAADKQNDTYDPLCERALDIFASCYGSEAGNIALRFLPFGGLYIAGGIAPKNLAILKKNNQFLEALIDKGRMRPVLEQVPVYVVLHDDVGTEGAKLLCRRMLIERQHSIKGLPLGGVSSSSVLTHASANAKPIALPAMGSPKLKAAPPPMLPLAAVANAAASTTPRPAVKLHQQQLDDDEQPEKQVKTGSRTGALLLSGIVCGAVGVAVGFQLAKNFPLWLRGANS